MTPTEIFAYGVLVGAAGFFAICGGMVAWIVARPHELRPQSRAERRREWRSSWSSYRRP